MHPHRKRSPTPPRRRGSSGSPSPPRTPSPERPGTPPLQPSPSKRRRVYFSPARLVAGKTPKLVEILPSVRESVSELVPDKGAPSTSKTEMQVIFEGVPMAPSEQVTEGDAEGVGPQPDDAMSGIDVDMGMLDINKPSCSGLQVIRMDVPSESGTDDDTSDESDKPDKLRSECRADDSPSPAGQVPPSPEVSPPSSPLHPGTPSSSSSSSVGIYLSSREPSPPPVGTPSSGNSSVAPTSPEPDHRSETPPVVAAASSSPSSSMPAIQQASVEGSSDAQGEKPKSEDLSSSDEAASAEVAAILAKTPEEEDPAGGGPSTAPDDPNASTSLDSLVRMKNRPMNPVQGLLDTGVASSSSGSDWPQVVERETLMRRFSLTTDFLRPTAYRDDENGYRRRTPQSLVHRTLRPRVAQNLPLQTPHVLRRSARLACKRRCSDSEALPTSDRWQEMPDITPKPGSSTEKPPGEGVGEPAQDVGEPAEDVGEPAAPASGSESDKESFQPDVVD